MTKKKATKKTAFKKPKVYDIPDVMQDVTVPLMVSKSGVDTGKQRRDSKKAEKYDKLITEKEELATLRATVITSIAALQARSADAPLSGLDGAIDLLQNKNLSNGQLAEALLSATSDVLDRLDIPPMDESLKKESPEITPVEGGIQIYLSRKSKQTIKIHVQ